MRRAAQTVQEHAIGVAIEDIDRAVEALEAPYADRILRLFRTAMAIEDPRERATRILELVDELGLEPPPPTNATLIWSKVAWMCWAIWSYVQPHPRSSQMRRPIPMRAASWSGGQVKPAARS